MLNNVVLVGRLTADPELRYTASGTAVCQFTLAVDRGFAKSDDGKRDADFIECVVWKDLAESVAKYKGKGDPLGVVGRLQIDSYEDSQGIRRKAARVIAGQVKFLPGGKRNDHPGGIEPPPPPEEPGWGKGELDIDLSGDDIPF